MDKNFSHFVLIIGIVVLTISIILLYRWYRDEHIHPKFRWIIGLLIGALVLADVAGIIYAAAFKKPTCVEMPKCNGFYNFHTNSCTVLEHGTALCSGMNCMYFNGAKGCCGPCGTNFTFCMGGPQWTLD